MTEPTENWIVKNRTYIYGGGEVWQPQCNKSRSDILLTVTQAIKGNAGKFLKGGSCYGKKVNKIFSTEGCTEELDDGISGIESRDDVLIIGMGHGGLLGGLDKELTYHPVTESVCMEAKKLYDTAQEFENWDLEKEIPECPLISNDVRKEVSEFRKAEEENSRHNKIIWNELTNCMEKDLAISGISAKANSCNLSVYPNSYDNIEPLLKNKNTREDTVKKELAEWGEKLSDIRKVYYNKDAPFVLEMKDGNKIVIAPILETGRIDDKEWEIKRILNQETREINYKIRSLLD